MKKRIISVCLAMALIFATLPQTAICAYATQSDNIAYEVREELIETLISKYGVTSQEQFVSCLGEEIQAYPSDIYGIASMAPLDINNDKINELVVLRVSENGNKNEAEIIAEIYQDSSEITLLASQSIYTVSFCDAANIYLFYSDVLDEYCMMVDSYSSGSYTGVSSWAAKVFTITENSIDKYGAWESVPFVGINADFEMELNGINAPFAKYCTEFDNLDNGLYYQPLCEVEHDIFGDSGTYTTRNHKLKIKRTSDIQQSILEDNAADMNAYRDILTMYYTSISCNWLNCDGDGWDELYDPDNVCYIISKYESQRSLEEVGYVLIDVNNDEQAELFISLFDVAESGSFYDMYTIVDSEIIHVVSAGERDRYNLAEDYSINNSGSGGTANSSDVNYRLGITDGTLKVNQAVIYDEWRDSENPYFYATTEYYNKETYETNYDVLRPISNEEASALLDSFPENTALELTPFDEYDPSASAESTYEDYARNEWIEQHMEYASSDEYEGEIVGGYDNRMMAVFRDALDDEDIKSYETRKVVSAILNLDIELSEEDMYELIIAEILYGERAQYITEETYNQNLRNSVANVAKVLVNMATSGDTAKEIPADTLSSIKESYELLRTLEFGSEEYGTTYSKFISLIKGNVKDLKSKLKTELVGDVAFTGLGIVIDGAFEQYEALEDILSYINNYVAYQSTSKQTQEVLAYLAVNVLYKYDSLYGVDEFIDELGLWDSMTNWADFQTALVSVMKAMAAYEQEGAAAIAEYAVEREREAGHKFGAKALKSVTVFVVEKAASCVPVINTILLVKNVANVVVSATIILDQIFTNVDEREYALDILTKAYCISVMLDKTVDDCVDSMSEDDFYSTTVFDESVSIYKKNLLFASGYALKYADMVLANAEEELREYDEGWSVDHLFTSRDELVAAVTWYSNSYKLLEEQQVAIREITCHDSNLQYNPLTDEIIYNFEDSRIYVVACPVDVIVTTDSGEQIAYLSGNENQIASGYEFYFHTIKLKDDSDEYIKVAIAPDEYQIELKGTDDGVMHAFVADFATSDVGKVETYFNIPIEKDSVGCFEVSFDDTNECSLVMDQVVYFNMESVEDIPTDSESDGVWVWGAGGVIACGIILIVILKKKSRK